LPAASSVYSATKASVDVITGVLAKELGPRKIRVNSINPGMIETEGVHSAGYIEGDFGAWIKSQSSLGRIGQTDDISPTAVYLASSNSKYLTGETIRVTGGIL
jgi:3-oxoacyl-[acyl-carrier protein] reductase